MTITGQHLIAGTWQRANDPQFSSVFPRTRENGKTIFADASTDEVNSAVQQAAAAFEETRHYSAEKLAHFLDTVADEIEALGDELLTTCDNETALGLPRLTGERGRTTNQLRAFAALLREGSYVDAIIDTAMPDRKPAPRPDIRQMLIPIGAVAVFTPNNFPLAFGVAGGDTASSFAAGCPVIAKGHPSHPATSELVAQAIEKAIKKCDFPAGFFSLVHGTGIDVGQTLVKHPDLAAVGFTGSLRGGRAIFDSAASRPNPIPVYAEMGSINPVVILPDALNNRTDALISGVTGSVTLGSGQFCTNPGLFFLVNSPQAQDFVKGVARAMHEQAPQLLLNAGVERELQKGVSALHNHEAVTLLTGGEVVHNGGFCFANTVMQTTAQAFLADPTLQEEHFGPVTLFVLCDDMNQLETTIQTLGGQLTATIHADDAELDLAQTMISILSQKAGRLLLNGYPTGVEVVHSMVHGGPYPATTAPNSTSVGMTAIRRFMRPIAYQNLPDRLLPDALKNANPLHIWRIVNNKYSNDAID